ncbi:ABC transporter ATP-binding protein [Lipingzhangella sp. LS1_29]|uniref:ABC transporter ATP-binding protein n=1 Tax=Lipingzhangella rawalii TaxID=2055835 RepID=A0ABU2H0D2_9ACTN|nr:ABC transporter ATP-binding protein [Lipingzhangella rawalii]MDS1268762.1 ABC transporter ATP-binding protein [Lipingzhangella rawalii]
MDTADDPLPIAVDVRDVVKRYGSVTAVAGLSLTAERGAVTAVLGPNGAGKTTTLEICTGFRRPDTGTARVLGRDPIRDARALRPRVGVMPQSGGIPTGARAGEWLRLMASFHRSPLSPQLLLERLGLCSVERTPFRRLSGGQQQRLSLAAAIIGRPELVFLDEPTAGLDPQARAATWELVDELRLAGAGVVLSTHYMEEAERLADHIVIVDHGRVIAEGSPVELTSNEREVRFRTRPGLDLQALAEALPSGTSATERAPGHYVVEATNPELVGPELIATITTWCAARDVLAEDVQVRTRTLEDVFLELTGQGLRES